MGRLTLIRSARFYTVIRTDRDIEFLVEIPIQVSEHQIEGSIGIFFPSFKRGGDVLAARVKDRLAGSIQGCQDQRHGDDEDPYP
jgi:hypothetical protein